MVRWSHFTTGQREIRCSLPRTTHLRSWHSASTSTCGCDSGLVWRISNFNTKWSEFKKAVRVITTNYRVILMKRKFAKYTGPMIRAQAMIRCVESFRYYDLRKRQRIAAKRFLKAWRNYHGSCDVWCGVRGVRSCSSYSGSCGDVDKDCGSSQAVRLCWFVRAEKDQDQTLESETNLSYSGTSAKICCGAGFQKATKGILSSSCRCSEGSWAVQLHEGASVLPQNCFCDFQDSTSCQTIHFRTSTQDEASSSTFVDSFRQNVRTSSSIFEAQVCVSSNSGHDKMGVSSR